MLQDAFTVSLPRKSFNLTLILENLINLAAETKSESQKMRKEHLEHPQLELIFLSRKKDLLLIIMYL